MSSFALASMSSELPYEAAASRVPFYSTIPFAFVSIADNRHLPPDAPNAGLGVRLSFKHYPGTQASSPPVYIFLSGPELHALELILLTELYHGSSSNRTDIYDAVRNNLAEAGIGRETLENYCRDKGMELDGALGPTRISRQHLPRAAEPVC